MILEREGHGHGLRASPGLVIDSWGNGRPGLIMPKWNIGWLGQKG